MTLLPQSARVLVASDRPSEALQVAGQLKDEFEHIQLSTNPELAAKDFEAFRPDVLVLAFKTLEKAQRYYLGLYRMGRAPLQHDHRTIILCNKDEVRTVFDLCKKEYFHDFVLYWPYTFDASHLAMSIWIAFRQMIAMRSLSALPREDVFAHVRHVHEVQSTLWVEPAPSGTLALKEPVHGLFPLVMVVDDDEVVQRMIGLVLESEPYEVIFAGNAPDAQRQLCDACPDVILMDIRMPGLDGVSFTRQLKATPRFAEIHIIILTGDATRETLASSIEAGSAEFMVKPFTRRTLLAKLAKVISGKPLRLMEGNTR